MTRARPTTARWRHASRLTAPGVVLALLAGGAVAVAADPNSAAPPEPVTALGDAPTAPPARPATQPALPPSATVTLVTGDQVRLTSVADGVDIESVSTGAEDPGTPLVEFAWAGDLYAVPAEAVPYLGSTMDPALFNITYLVRAGLDDAHSTSVPVTVREKGRTAASLPAVTVTRVVDGSATATVAKKDAPAFGALLADQWAADRASRSAKGALPGIDRISLTPPKGKPAPPESPLLAQAAPKSARTKYHTLTLDPVDRDGLPGVAVGYLHNLDHPERFAALVIAAGAGPLSFSVPEGIYGAEFSVLTGSPDDRGTTGSVVLAPEVTVESDRTVTLDARDAVPYAVSVNPPVQPQPGWRNEKLGITRFNDAREGARTAPWYQVQGWMRLLSSPRYGVQTLYATPTEPVTKGYLELSGFTSLSDTERTSVNPRYLMAFAWEQQVPGSLTSVVRAADLTTVRTDVYGSPSGVIPGRATRVAPSVFTPWSFNYFGNGTEGSPGERVDHWYSNEPDLVAWRTMVHTDEGTNMYGPRRTIRPGEQIREEWNKGPVVPSPTARHFEATPINPYFGNNGPQGTDMLRTVCAACRQDDNAVFVAHPLGDSGGHFALSDFLIDPARYQVDFYRDGQLAATTRSMPSGMVSDRLRLPMLPERAEYRLDWATTRRGDAAATQRTRWTFSSGRDDPSAALPGVSRCQPDPSRGCSFLPLLFPSYDLSLDHAGRAPAGTSFELPFSIGYQQYQGTPSGLAATVAVSFDGGATWTEPVAATDRGDGRFTTTVSHPTLDRTDGFVAIRVRAHDGAGNSVDQTVTRAYGLRQS